MEEVTEFSVFFLGGRAEENCTAPARRSAGGLYSGAAEFGKVETLVSHVERVWTVRCFLIPQPGSLNLPATPKTVRMRSCVTFGHVRTRGGLATVFFSSLSKFPFLFLFFAFWFSSLWVSQLLKK
jgi:hypothetical protein